MIKEFRGLFEKLRELENERKSIISMLAGSKKKFDIDEFNTTKRMNFNCENRYCLHLYE